MSDKIEKYSDKFRKMIFEFITEDEDILYEDEDNIYMTNPASFGMIKIKKSTISEHIDNSIENYNSDCIQQLLYHIHWSIIYWGDSYTCDEADEFLKEHNCKPYIWF